MTPQHIFNLVVAVVLLLTFLGDYVHRRIHASVLSAIETHSQAIRSMQDVLRDLAKATNANTSVIKTLRGGPIKTAIHERDLDITPQE